MKTILLSLGLLAISALSACGDADASGGSSSGGSSAGPGGASSAGGENAGGSSAGGAGGGAGAGVPDIPTCIALCDSVDDCVAPSPISDADNWACDGECEYLGCASDDECQMAFMNPNYACDAGAAAVPTCVPTCNVVDDCFLPSPLYDQDNWACSSQRCEYQGCTSDDECQMGFQMPNYACIDGGAGVPFCQRTCAAPADCLSPTPLYDADNWACEAEVCVYIGCNTTEECVQTLMNGNYVCQE